MQKEIISVWHVNAPVTSVQLKVLICIEIFSLFDLQ